MSSNADNSGNELKIIQQIEYYFGDINLVRDKFLKEVMQKNDGWVPIETLLTFNRLKSITSDSTVVVESLRKSSSGLLEISECEKKIRRRTEKPLPELTDEYKTTLLERTVHAKGFPNDSKLDDVMTFFKQFGSIESIEMRRTLKNKSFKGCVFVVFSSKEEAETFINSDDVKYNDSPLLRENKLQYFARKKSYHESRRNKLKSKNGESRDKCDTEVDAEDDNEEENDNSDVASGSQSKNAIKIEGAVLKLKGVSKETSFVAIKKAFIQHGRVEYVESVNEQLESFVRFGEKDGAKIALEKAKIISGGDEAIKVEIAGNDVEAEVLSGDEELQYWLNYQKNRSKSIESRSRLKKGRKGKSMWQRGNKRKSFHSRFSGSDAKHAKLDSDTLHTTSEQQTNVKVEPQSDDRSETVSESNNIKQESDGSNQNNVKISKSENE